MVLLLLLAFPALADTTVTFIDVGQGDSIWIHDDTGHDVLIDAGEKIDEVVAIGPAIMMKMVSELTRPHAIPTLVSLNTIMIDGTGMCGGCRVGVGGKTQFVCVDGPEFDGHQVDFDLMMRRQSMYTELERRSYEEYRAQHRCRLEPELAAPRSTPLVRGEGAR